ncbi:helix-turn-helix domain-containing protein [Trueperella pyogenes]|uniref:ATP-binding protein n=1 Tax=Trueperella pyogenes TaxID=1661 RepID=A0ABV3NCQ3_9ACTO|nr:ATP-binding protein [Trueperella pyogenes]UVJ58955.1 ATP-binding protein [Trueperella pyogenes]
MHRELNKPENEQVAHEFFVQLIEQQVREQDDLDFKRDAYQAQDKKKQWELAKDVCAMANSGGGWIICGIIDENETAVAFSGLELAPTSETSIHQLIENQIEPPLTVATRVYTDEDQQNVVLTIRVPDSSDKPHLLHAKFDKDDTKPFVVPVRNGARTRWLDERSIRSLYFKSNRASQIHEETHNSYLEEAVVHSPRNKGACIVIVASLTNPKESRRISEDRIRDLLASDERRKYLRSSLVWNFFDDDGVRISVGDQRLIVRYVGRKDDARIDFLDDGAIEIVSRTGGIVDDPRAAQSYPVGQPSHLRTIDVEGVIAQGINLIDQATAEHETSDVNIDVRLVYQGTEPLLIRRMYSYGDSLQDPSASMPIAVFRTVHYVLPAQRSTETVRKAVYEIATQVLNQGEIAWPSYIALPDDDTKD